MRRSATLPKGESTLGVRLAADGTTQTRFNLTLWLIEKSEKVGK
jgi:hypothetical protein